MELLALWIVLGVLALLIFFVAIPNILTAVIVFKHHLVRKDKNHWTRECSALNNPEQVEMYEKATAWAEKNAEFRKDLDTVNDGFKLYAEYYDFGFDKAVIIIAGRTEGCRYSQYFAPAYKASGYNILAIDNRAHGLSDGKYNAVGLKEYRDTLQWGKLLHDEHGINEVVLHGICIGSANALYAMTSEDTPDYFKGMVADGMYYTFAESFKNHMIEMKKPIFPVFQEIMLLTKIVCGVDAVHNGPIYCIDKLEKPILFIYSKLDVFSTPEDAKKLYAKCKAPKRIAWFEKGAHSHVRINDEEGYDKAIIDFLAEKDTLTCEEG